MAFDVDALRECLARLGAGASPDFRVAFSGGLDSSVLLAAAAEAAPGRVSAIHVDHGLHPASADWAERCRERCQALGVGFAVARVDARHDTGESPEAAARAARYRALASLVAPREVLLTAQQADDQLETVLLQLLRGAGVAGLAAMPERAAFGPGEMWRPLLGFSRDELSAWARARGLAWIEDPANRDVRLARNHLRHAVLPGLKAYWPAAAVVAGRSARHCAEAAGLLDELAELDAGICLEEGGLDLGAMAGLSRARQANLVRWYARSRRLPLPDERRLRALLDQLQARPDANPRVTWPGVVALRHRDRLVLLPESALGAPPGPVAWPDPFEPLPLGPGLGELSLESTEDGGLDPSAVTAGPWSVDYRRGGERLTLPGRSHRAQLKKLLNAAGVPPWERARMPLVRVGGRLAAVGSRWVASEWWSPPGNKGLRVRWRREAPSP